MEIYDMCRTPAKSSRRAVGLLAVAFVLATASGAEMWIPLADYVGKCVLIVKARTVVAEDGPLTFEVLESWKGQYDPADFVDTTPEGRFFASRGEHGVVDVSDGQEVVFFFTSDDQTVTGKLSRHSTAFPVREGKVVYASSDDTAFFPEDQRLAREYPLDELRAIIRDLVAKDSRE